MSAYPVHYRVEPSLRFTRLQLLVRLIAYCVLGLLGLSFGGVLALGYVALPLLAAVRVSTVGPERYVQHDGPRIAQALRWLAAICAWTGLVVDRLPTQAPDEVVHLEIEATARPTTSSAAWRVVTGLPSALGLGLLCIVGTFVWLWAALSILVGERVGDRPLHYLVGLQRWSLRLLAYQASLVDDYPPFSFTDAPGPALPTAKAAS